MVSECEWLSKLEEQPASFSEILNQAQPQNATDQDLLEGVGTTSAVQNRASQQRNSNFI